MIGHGAGKYPDALIWCEVDVHLKIGAFTRRQYDLDRS
jgi:hypothetical protein